MINRSYLRTFFLIFFVASFFLSCDDESNILLESGVSKELAIFRTNTIENLKYNLFFDFSKNESEPIISKLVLSFAFKKEITDLILDFKSSSGNILKITIGDKSVVYKFENEHLIIDKDLLSVKNEISIDFIAGNKFLNRSEDYFYSLFVPDKASSCFPLFDQPDLKSTYKLTLNIPKNWVALSNSSVAELQIYDGYSKVIFNETQLMSSYLFSFTAGNYKVEDISLFDRKIKLYHLEKDSIKVASNIQEIARIQDKCLEWIENYTEIKYPFEKFDIVAIPNLPFDGMENPGVLYYKETSLFLDNKNSSFQKIERTNLIAHESAHMWFGNLVTMTWFDEIWLKEVLASHIASKIVNSEYPDQNNDLLFLMRNYPAAYDIDRTKGTHSITQDLDNSKYSNMLYDAITYHKSQIVFKILENKIGEEIFNKSINLYLNEYAYKNSGWVDLLKIIKSNTTEDLTIWEKDWLNAAEIPIIGYSMKEKNSVLTKFRILSNRKGDSSFGPQKLTLGFGNNNEFKSVMIDIKQQSQKINLDTTTVSPQYLFTNYGGLGYGYFKMGPVSKDYFLKNMHLIDSELTRGSIWINLYEAVLRDDIEADKWVDSALKAITKEKEPIIVKYLNEKLVTIFWGFLSDEKRASIGSKMEGIFFNMAINTESDELRSSYFETFYKIVTTPNGINLMTRIWDQNTVKENMNLSEDNYIALAYELAIRKPDSANYILKKQAGNINNLKKKERMKWVMKVLDSNSNVRDQFFESLKERKNRLNEEWVIEAIKYLHHPLKQKQSIKYILPSLAILEDLQISGSIFFTENWLNATLRGHRSENATDLVRQFLYRNNKYPVNLKNKILQSADLLFKSNEIMMRRKRELLIE